MTNKWRCQDGSGAGAGILEKVSTAKAAGRDFGLGKVRAVVGVRDQNLLGVWVISQLAAAAPLNAEPVGIRGAVELAIKPRLSSHAAFLTAG
jgi:hypothetical protein